MKVSLNYVILVGPVLLLVDSPLVGDLFVRSLSMFDLKFGIDDSFVVSKKCVCVNYDLLGHFSHIMFSAGVVVHTRTCWVTLHLHAKLNNFWNCNKKIL